LNGLTLGDAFSKSSAAGACVSGEGERKGAGCGHVEDQTIPELLLLPRSSARLRSELIAEYIHLLQAAMSARQTPHGAVEWLVRPCAGRASACQARFHARSACSFSQRRVTQLRTKYMAVDRWIAVDRSVGVVVLDRAQ